jgi:predicted GNAT family acetyltransferase
MIENGYGICFNDWLFDKKIRNHLRLLIIISSLSSKLGYCTASNEYLSNLFDEHTVVISRRVKKLEKQGYIRCEYMKRGAEILGRKIYVLRLTKTLIDDKQISSPTINKKVKENNISSNNKKVSINDTLTYMGEKRKIFAPPTFEQVKEEFEKRGYTETLAQKFIDHYESNGWMVGKNKMKSWTHAITTWITNPENDRFKKKDTKKDAYLEMLGDVDDLF